MWKNSFVLSKLIGILFVSILSFMMLPWYNTYESFWWDENFFPNSTLD